MNQTTCCAFTMCRNEELHLHVWLSYYAAELGEEACYVLIEPNDKTVDVEKLAFPNVNFIVQPSPKPGSQTTGFYDNDLEVWRLAVVKQWQAKLLRTYACCIFGDTDEILMPESSLLDFCNDVFIPSDADRIRSECWQPVQQRGEKAVSRLSGTFVLNDRTKMWRLPTYDKTSLVRTPQKYSKGFHLTYMGDKKRVDDVVDPRLPLLHMWRNDMDDWMQDAVWRYEGVTKESAELYFETHKGPWVDPRPNWNPHAVGDATEIPSTWKKRLIWK